MADHLDRDIERVIQHLQDQPPDMGRFKIKPSINWVAVIIQIATMTAMLGMIYGKLDGRLTLIEYRLGQIELHVNRVIMP